VRGDIGNLEDLDQLFATISSITDASTSCCQRRLRSSAALGAITEQRRRNLRVTSRECYGAEGVALMPMAAVVINGSMAGAKGCRLQRLRASKAALRSFARGDGYSRRAGSA